MLFEWQSYELEGEWRVFLVIFKNKHNLTCVDVIVFVFLQTNI